MKVTKKSKWLIGIGLTLILAGGGWSIEQQRWYRSRTWVPLHMPVTLDVGRVRSPEFTVNLDEDFIILLAVDRTIPSEPALKVLGVGNSPMQPNDGRGFKLAWEVEADGSVLKRGMSDGGNDEAYWSSTTGRIVGFFHAQKGKRYRITLDVVEDGSRLAPYHPTLEVRVDIFTIDGYAIGSGLTQLVGQVFAGLGLVLLIAGMVVARRTALHRATP